MPSVFKTFIACGLACAALALSPCHAETERAQYALQITLEENGEILDQPKIIVEQGKTYFVSLSGRSDYDFRISIPADTRLAVQEQFERDLGQHASNFIVVNSRLSFETADLPADIHEDAREVNSSLLLLKTGRPIRSDIPMETRHLVSESGTKIETLAITVEANPFNAST
ncbi:MAG: hypothetical protein AAGG45_05695 [Pseudomonadota bacterium]